MINDDNQFAVTQERIAYFLRLLQQLRATTEVDEFQVVATGYRAEIERMQKDVLDYLTHSPPLPAAKAG